MTRVGSKQRPKNYQSDRPTLPPDHLHLVRRKFLTPIIPRQILSICCLCRLFGLMRLPAIDDFDQVWIVRINVSEPMRWSRDGFDVVFNQRSGSQLTELSRAQEVQQIQRVCSHTSLYWLLFSHFNNTDFINVYYRRKTTSSFSLLSKPWPRT